MRFVLDALAALTTIAFAIGAPLGAETIRYLIQ